MRIPSKINKNTQDTYRPSKQCLDLLGEVSRQLLSEDFDWDQDQIPNLVTFCVKTINQNVDKNLDFNKLPLEDQEYLLELLDIELPLEIVIPLIDDEDYWKRRYFAKFGQVTTPKPTEWLWKSLFLEKHIQNLLEQAQPEYEDEKDIEHLELYCPYVKRLILNQLKVWKPPSSMLDDEIPEVLPVDHIDFNIVFQHLKNLQEIRIVFGEKNVGDTFNANMFKLSPSDCTRLINSINNLEFLTILQIHRTRLDDDHMRKLSHSLIQNQTLKYLDLSHCSISDCGCFCLAKLLMIHQNLEILNVSFNNIKSKGVESLCYALLQPNATPLRELYLQFNPIEERGCLVILTILVQRQQFEIVSIAGCQFTGDGAVGIAQMIGLNTSLKHLDICNNRIGEDVGNVLIDNLRNNQTLQSLDLRETQINKEQESIIEQLLERNRSNVENIFL